MRLRIAVAAPIRVGGREQQINKLEYVRDGGRVHAVSTRKLARVLLHHGERTLDDWNAEVLTRGQDADLTRFLRAKDLLDPRTLGEISRYSAPDAGGVENTFQPHARDARGRLFVPGTAIKGAIRAAVTWYLVDEGKANRYVRNSRSNRAKFYASSLDRETLQSYELPRRRLRAGPHHDLLRAVKVSDAYGGLGSRIEKILIQSYTEDRGVRTASLGASDTIYVECLEPGSWAAFDLKVDRSILADFRRESARLPFDDEASLLARVREFYAAAWKFEQDYYGSGNAGKADHAEDAGQARTPSGPPAFEEWLRSEKGIDPVSLSRRGKKRRMLEAEYRRAYDLFDTPDPASETPQKQQEVWPAGRNRVVQDGHEMRLREIRKFYGGSSPGFRLGWGSGLMSTTVDMRLDEENVGRVLNVINSRHHPQPVPREGPKSRKLVGEGRNPRWPMGWARLEEVRR